MKLLFDENLSPRLVDLLAADFPGCSHIERLGMRGAADAAVWNYARENGCAIVSKDNDFRQRAFLDGPPPKVVWQAQARTHASTRRHRLRPKAPRYSNVVRDDGLSRVIGQIWLCSVFMAVSRLGALPPQHAACMLARIGRVLFGQRPLATKLVQT